MKKRMLSILLAMLLVISVLPAALADGAVVVGGSTTDLTQAAAWIIDREEPDNFSVAGGMISFTVKETPAAEAWNAWQGRGALPEVSFADTWAVEYTLAVTDEMLTTDNVNASMWIQIDEAGGNSAASQNDCVDWSIVQFLNNGTGSKFQTWDSTNGVWNDVTAVAPEAGTYAIKVVFENGDVTQYINGKLVNTYNVGVATTRPAYLIAQGRSYGAAFDVEMSVPTVTDPYDVPPTDLTDEGVWIIDREEPDDFTVADGMVSFTVKETPAAEAWNAWQGRGTYPKVDFADSWAVEYTMTITKEMLLTDHVNASLWIQVDEDNGNTAASQNDCVDWSIVQFVNNGTESKFQTWDSNEGVWKDVVRFPARMLTYTFKTVYKDGVITQYIDDQEINRYDLGTAETRPAYLIAQGRSYGAAFDVEMSIPTITIPYVETPSYADEYYAAVIAASNPVTAAAAANGNYSIDQKNAVPGSSVTITAVPDKGYTVDDVTVTDKDGNGVRVRSLGYNRFSFTMPEGEVDVKVTFKEDNSKANAVNQFVDVTPNDYYYDAVIWAAENGITTGVDATHFDPEAPITRAEVVTFLWRAAGEPEPTGMSSFSDVSANNYYAKAVAWAVEMGITDGMGDGQFAPDANCTRAQIVTFLARFAGAADGNAASSFSDVNSSDYYAASVAWAKDNNVTSGTSATTFSPMDNCSRGQVVTFLYRWMAK